MGQRNVVVLDGFTLNDIPWDGYDAFASLTIYDNTAADQVAERAAEAEILLTNKVLIGAEQMDALPKLRYIGVLATGYDNIDLAAAAARGIVVTNVPVYADYSVAQLVFALLLELCYRVSLHHKTVAEDKKWSGYHINSYWEFPLVGLQGRTMGIIGMGKIGERVGRIAEAFGMNVVGYDAYPRKIESIRAFSWATLDELYAKSDVVSIHCPLFDSTREMMNYDAFCKMKKTAFFINTSRGALVAERDLRRALDEGQIAGAGLDVLSQEPPAYDNPLFEAKNCVITPHIGWATVDARKLLLREALENIRAWVRGEPIHVVH